jgi:acetyl-CoA carboxylase biotin carboxylase subunit
VSALVTGEITKLLIANRGEIAIRIARAARELGIPTVQVYSEADQTSLPTLIADEAAYIGASHASKSYLNIDAIIKAAKDFGADSVHPGYGFLSESFRFAEAIESQGFTFVGPAASTIRLMGDKVAARKHAMEHDVPTIPGSIDRIQNIDEARTIVSNLGFPVMIKAAAGGGGKGIRLISSMEQFEQFIPQAKAEARAAFGDDGLFIEKAMQNARHLEVQILGDGTDVLHFHERECSMQRQRQKIWEEAPATLVPEKIRSELCNAAVSLGKSIRYCGAGTVEFLLDQDAGKFFFLEMNTRIQVEHPVTEMITGIDLVREMIRVSSGEQLRYSQDEILSRGHAIEVRINAEDPTSEFMPCPGTVTELSIPGGPGVRFDSMLYSGCNIPPFYDSLLGKLIVWDENRSSAMRRLGSALSELKIGGINTTVGLLRALVSDQEVKSGGVTTAWLEQWLGKNARLLD